MQFFGISLGKKKEGVDQGQKPGGGIKQQIAQVATIVNRYQTTLVAIFVALLLAVTSLRMLHYMNPPVDDEKVQDALSKNTKIRIDPKVVQKIEQLQDSGTTTTPQVESGRTNPFTE
jgi:hypothetical protein